MREMLSRSVVSMRALLLRRHVKNKYDFNRATAPDNFILYIPRDKSEKYLD